MENVHKGGSIRVAVTLAQKACTAIAGGCLVVMLVIIVIGVFSRYIFNLPFYFVEEYSGYLLVGIGFLGAGYAFHKGVHIKVDSVVERLPRRARAGLETITTLIGICILAILTWSGAKLFLMDFRGRVVSSTIMQTPLWIPESFVLIGWVLLLLMLILYMMDRLKEWRG